MSPRDALQKAARRTRFDDPAPGYELRNHLTATVRRAIDRNRFEAGARPRIGTQANYKALSDAIENPTFLLFPVQHSIGARAVDAPIGRRAVPPTGGTP